MKSNVKYGEVCIKRDAVSCIHMAHHAFFYAGDLEQGIETALGFTEKLGLEVQGNPDVIQLRYQTLAVDEARRITQLIHQAPVAGDKKVLVIAAGRFFEESQNAFLKVFEEPPAGTTLILVIPSEGQLLPTLRSRLLPLPSDSDAAVNMEHVRSFLSASAPEREKMISKLVERTKADKDEEKQAARLEALSLAKGLQVAVYDARKKSDSSEELLLLAEDLDHFIPILHTASAPIKPIFEHLLLVLPASLTKKI